jgi:hypothetical protein
MSYHYIHNNPTTWPAFYYCAVVWYRANSGELRTFALECVRVGHPSIKLLVENQLYSNEGLRTRSIA